MIHRSQDKEQLMGGDANTPTHIPSGGWKQIASRVWRQVDETHMWLIAAGVAFYAILSIFPLLIAMVSIYGLVADASVVESQINRMSDILPPDVRVLLSEQLNAIVSSSPQSLSLGVIISIILTLWTVSTGMYYLISALNIVYHEDEKRSFLQVRGIAFGLTLLMIISAILSLSLIAGLPAMLTFTGLSGLIEQLLLVGRWPLLAFGGMLFLAVINRYGPCRRDAKWRWVTVGSSGVTLVWLFASALFSYYVSNFGNYNETYGSLATPVIMMTWLYLSSFLLLLGSAFNAETEHQTAQDTTKGESKPMGQRGAYMADTLPSQS